MPFAFALNRLTGFFNLITGNHAVEIQGVPFNLRVFLDPKKMIEVINRYNVKKAAHDVNLCVGPLNGIAGQYHMESGRIDVDVLEIAAAKIKDGDPEKLDREVTEVLAHEFRHKCQREKHSMFGMKWDQWAMFFGLKILLIVFVLIPGAMGSVKMILHGTQWWSMPLGIIGCFGIWMLFRFFWALTAIVAYRFSWHERDARKFAREAVDDPAWREIITVQKVDLSNDQIRQAMMDQLLMQIQHQFGVPITRR